MMRRARKGISSQGSDRLLFATVGRIPQQEGDNVDLRDKLRKTLSFQKWLDCIGICSVLVFFSIGIVGFFFFDQHQILDIGKWNITSKSVAKMPTPIALEDGLQSTHREPATGGTRSDMRMRLQKANTEDSRGKSQEGPGALSESLRKKREPLRQSSSPRFVTVVMPSVVNPTGRRKRLDSIAETWGGSARAIYVVHNNDEFPVGRERVFEEVSPGTTSTVFPMVLVVPDSISPDEGVPRIQHVIKTVSESALDADFAFFVNDHTFVIPEHLCEYLSGLNPSDELYAGHALKENGSDYAFNSGAAGYVLSRTTMRHLVQKWEHEKDSKCLAKNAPKWFQGNPGLVTASCLQHSMNIAAIDTRDDAGMHRFHAFGLVSTVAGKVDQWYINKHKGLKDFWVDVNENVTKEDVLPGIGQDCCSAATVSFHYVEFSETRALFHVRQELLQKPNMSDEELRSLIKTEWPSTGKGLGFYSQHVPRDEETDAWTDLLVVLRKITQANIDMKEANAAMC